VFSPLQPGFPPQNQTQPGGWPAPLNAGSSPSPTWKDGGESGSHSRASSPSGDRSNLTGMERLNSHESQRSAEKQARANPTVMERMNSHESQRSMELQRVNSHDHQRVNSMDSQSKPTSPTKAPWAEPTPPAGPNLRSIQEQESKVADIRSAERNRVAADMLRLEALSLVEPPPSMMASPGGWASNGSNGPSLAQIMAQEEKGKKTRGDAIKAASAGWSRVAASGASSAPEWTVASGKVRTVSTGSKDVSAKPAVVGNASAPPKRPDPTVAWCLDRLSVISSPAFNGKS
jgi:hypothetical protein